MTVSQALGRLQDRISLRATFLSPDLEPRVATSLFCVNQCAFAVGRCHDGVPDGCDTIFTLSEDFVRVEHDCQDRQPPESSGAWVFASLDERVSVRGW
jgi:hypothetical protein